MTWREDEGMSIYFNGCKVAQIDTPSPFTGSNPGSITNMILGKSNRNIKYGEVTFDHLAFYDAYFTMDDAWLYFSG